MAPQFFVQLNPHGARAEFLCRHDGNPAVAGTEIVEKIIPADFSKLQHLPANGPGRGRKEGRRPHLLERLLQAGGGGPRPPEERKAHRNKYAAGLSALSARLRLYAENFIWVLLCRPSSPGFAGLL